MQSSRIREKTTNRLLGKFLREIETILSQSLEAELNITTANPPAKNKCIQMYGEVYQFTNSLVKKLNVSYIDYVNLLLNLLELRDQIYISSDLRTTIDAILKKQLIHLQEMPWDEQKTDRSNIEMQLSKLKEIAANEEKRAFFDKWGGSNSINYPIWARWVAQFKEPHPDIKEGKYRTFMTGFFYSVKKTSGYASDEDKTFTQPQYRNERLMDGVEHDSHILFDYEDFKKEISIWTPQNISTLLAEYVVNCYEQDKTIDYKKLQADLSSYILKPLLLEYLNNIIEKLNTDTKALVINKYNEEDFKCTKKSFQEKIEKALEKNFTLINPVITSTSLDTNPISRDHFILPAPVESLIPLEQTSSDESTILNYIASSPFFYFGIGTLLGLILITAIIFTAGAAAAPAIVGGGLLAFLNISASSSVTAIVGDAILLGLPLLGGALGMLTYGIAKGISKLFAWCRGKEGYSSDSEARVEPSLSTPAQLAATFGPPAAPSVTPPAQSVAATNTPPRAPTQNISVQPAFRPRLGS